MYSRFKCLLIRNTDFSTINCWWAWEIFPFPVVDGSQDIQVVFKSFSLCQSWFVQASLLPMFEIQLYFKRKLICMLQFHPNILKYIIWKDLFIVLVSSKVFPFLVKRRNCCNSALFSPEEIWSETRKWQSCLTFSYRSVDNGSFVESMWVEWYAVGLGPGHMLWVIHLIAAGQ